MIIATLFELERLDSVLEQLEAELRDVRRREARNPELEAAEARLDALRQQEQAVAVEQRTLESELADIESKMKRDQARMYAGQIVDPRELASLERELEHYGQRRDETEERCLAVMERADGLQADLAEASRRANELRERWEVDRPALAEEADRITDTLASLQAEREAVAASIEPRALDHYRRLRGSLGHAVTPVSSGICQSCRVAVPAKDVQHARADQLVTCSNCARILYVGS